MKKKLLNGLKDVLAMEDKLWNLLKTDDVSNIRMAWKLCIASGFSKIDFILMMFTIDEINNDRSVTENMAITQFDGWYVSLTFDCEEGRCMLTIEDDHSEVLKQYRRLYIYYRSCWDTYNGIDKLTMFSSATFISESMRIEALELQRYYNASVGSMIVEAYRDLVLSHKDFIIEWFTKCIKNG